MTSPLLDRLKDSGQTKIAHYVSVSKPETISTLISQLESVDLKELGELCQSADQDEVPRDYSKLSPPKAYRLGSTKSETLSDAVTAGEKLLQEGKVAALLVAGGQGSRLGFDHPKGMYPIGPVSGKTLFQIHIEKIVARGIRYGKSIPLFLMTSPATHDETVEFLEQHDRFGLPQEDLHIFCQGTMPAIELESKQLLLSAPDELALSPDGHGGMLAALVTSGGLEAMKNRGIEQVYYFQVDNPLADVGEPEFMGLHHISGSEMSTQVVAKQEPDEKLGILAELDGSLQLVEYSELPTEFAELRTDDGSLQHWAGNIAVHGIQVAFLQRMASEAGSLPWHKAIKKVPFVNATGEQVTPEEPNAIKFERFIFDLLPNAKDPIVVEVDPALRFAPVKNADGAPKDTPSLSKAALVNLYHSWLKQCGIEAADKPVEISALVALDANELKQKLEKDPSLAESDLIEPK